MPRPRKAGPVAGTVETANGWIPKHAAAKLLGVSIRQIENRAARGEITKRVLPKLQGERAARVEYSRSDIDRILAGGTAQVRINRVPDPIIRNQSSDANWVIPWRSMSKEEFKHLYPPAPAASDFAAALTAALAPAGKPWLSLREAAEYSGLPARWLREAARAGKLRAQNVGEKRERWMFPRDGLN